MQERKPCSHQYTTKVTGTLASMHPGLVRMCGTLSPMHTIIAMACMTKGTTMSRIVVLLPRYMANTEEFPGKLKVQGLERGTRTHI